MKAVTWHGKSDIRCESVPDPAIEDGRDAIIRVTACAICGSDLHIFDGVIPGMKSGTCSATRPWAKWLRSVRIMPNSRSATGWWCPSPSPAANVSSVRNGFDSGCERSNPDKKKAKKLWGHSPAGFSGIRISWEVFPAGKRNIFASPTPTRSDKGPGGAHGRASSLSLRHFSNRLHGGRFLQSEGRRNGCGLGLRPCWPIRDQERLPAGGGARNRDRHSAGAAAARGSFRRRDGRFQEAGRLRNHSGSDRKVVAQTHASTRSAQSQTLAPGSMLSSIASRSQHSWERTGRTCCARPFTAAGTSERYRLLASTAAMSTKSQWAPPSTAD